MDWLWTELGLLIRLIKVLHHVTTIKVLHHVTTSTLSLFYTLHKSLSDTPGFLSLHAPRSYQLATASTSPTILTNCSIHSEVKKERDCLYSRQQYNKFCIEELPQILWLHTGFMFFYNLILNIFCGPKLIIQC
jgi:hypothetical protein